MQHNLLLVRKFKTYSYLYLILKEVETRDLKRQISTTQRVHHTIVIIVLF